MIEKINGSLVPLSRGEMEITNPRGSARRFLMAASQIGESGIPWTSGNDAIALSDKLLRLADAQIENGDTDLGSRTVQAVMGMVPTFAFNQRERNEWYVSEEQFETVLTAAGLLIKANQDPTEVLSFARSFIPNLKRNTPDRYVGNMRNFIVVLAKAGLTEESFGKLKEIEDISRRASGYGQGIKNEVDQTYKDMAVVLIGRGESETASHLLGAKIKDPVIKVRSYNEAAQAAAEAGGDPREYFDGAVKTAVKLLAEGNKEVVELLIEIAAAEAKQKVSPGLNHAVRIDKKLIQGDTLGVAFAAAARIPDQAYRYAGSRVVRSYEARLNALLQVAEAYWKNGQDSSVVLEKALEIAYPDGDFVDGDSVDSAYFSNFNKKRIWTDVLFQVASVMIDQGVIKDVNGLRKLFYRGRRPSMSLDYRSFEYIFRHPEEQIGHFPPQYHSMTMKGVDKPYFIRGFSPTELTKEEIENLYSERSSLDSLSDMDDALGLVVKLQLKNGLTTEATTTINFIRDLTEKNRLLQEILAAQVSIGDTTQAQQTEGLIGQTLVKSLREEQESLQKKREGGGITGVGMIEFLNEKDILRAHSLAERIPLAAKLMAEGDNRALQAILGEIRELSINKFGYPSLDHIDSYMQAAKALHTVGADPTIAFEWAKTDIKKLFDFKVEIPKHAYYRMPSDLKSTVEEAEKDDEINHRTALVEIIRQARSRKFKEAVQMAEGITDIKQKDLAYYRLAIYYCSEGQYTRSVSLAKRIEGENDRNNTLVIIRKYASPKRPSDFSIYAHRADEADGEINRSPLITVASTQAEVGQHKEALKTLSEIPLRYQDEARYNLGVFYLKLGQIDQAIEIVRHTKSPWIGISVLIAFGRYQSRQAQRLAALPEGSEMPETLAQILAAEQPDKEELIEEEEE